ncbi:Arc family DNA-binding protein [Komagataeibacter intermedius]|uniref:Arc family DNA-binding protein n=1 Tax=Komagataeibacter intermedius TaxID=66229 RepID=UPI003B42BEB0
MARVRVPPELQEKILRSAAGNRRSINSELLLILERHYAKTEKASGSSLATSPDASHAE